MKKKVSIPQLVLEELVIKQLPRGKRNVIAVHSSDQATVLLTEKGEVYCTSWRDGWGRFPFTGFNRPKCLAVVKALMKMGALPGDAAEKWAANEARLQEASHRASLADKVLELVEEGELSLSQRQLDKMEKLIKDGDNHTVGRIIRRRMQRDKRHGKLPGKK